MPAIRPVELSNRLAQDPAPLVIDLRSPEEFADGTIPGARNLPYSDDLAARFGQEIGRSTSVVFVCTWGHKSAIACIGLRRHGLRDMRYLDGGMEAWGLAAMPVERGLRAAAGFGRGAVPAEPRSEEPDRRRAASGDAMSDAP
jgi:rhodanese-related sulfurtransferase